MRNFLPTTAVLRGSSVSPVLGLGGRGPIGVWVFFFGGGGERGTDLCPEPSFSSSSPHPPPFHRRTRGCAPGAAIGRRPSGGRLPLAGGRGAVRCFPAPPL